jgi:predicted alpha/beta-hydrolase family hydrolase
VVIGGKSIGGRIASLVAAGMETPVEIAALVFLGYPLHPPGRPDKLRDAHLPQIKAPMLFVQGARDTFGTTGEIGDLIKRLHLPATLYPIEGGDHSLKVPKKGNPPQAEIYETTMDEIARWLHQSSH